MGGRDVFSFVADFLKQLFARTQPDELDLNVFVGLEAAEFDQLAGQIDDLDRFAHVQHKDFSPGALGRAPA